ncbi:MAG: hypothetical protein ACFFCV_06450 [Promethearchaeota archaeon]
MVKVRILEKNKDFLIKEVKYKKPKFNRKYRDNIEILAYFDDINEIKQREING